MRRIGSVALACVVVWAFAIPAEAGLTNWQYNPATKHVYAITDSNQTWIASEAEAAGAGGHLVAVGDAAENTWVLGNYGTYHWIGFTDDTAYGGTEWGDTSGQLYPPAGDRGKGWVWTSGDAVTYQNWGPNEPNNSGGAENYCQIRSTGWNDYPGPTKFYKGVVEFNNTLDPAALTWITSPVTGNHYAKTQAAPFMAVETFAQSQSAHLTKIDNAAEDAWVIDTFKVAAGSGHYTWIGLQRVGTGNTSADFQWLADGTNPSYTNWSGGEPNNPSEDGVNVFLATGDSRFGKWNDYPGTNVRQGIIEKPGRTAVWRCDPATGRLYAETDRLDWANARAQAQAWGADLATINNAAENTFVADTFKGSDPNISNRDHYKWIGLNDKAAEGTWQWASGEPVAYTNWHSPAEPSGDGDTVNMFFNTQDTARYAKWNDLPEDQALYAIAEKAGRVPVWRYNPTTKHWYAETDALYSTEAEKQAQAWGGHLVTINDAAEEAWLVANGYDYRWIGFNDQDTEGHWVWAAGDGGYGDGQWPNWVDGTSYAHWGAGEPNNSTNEDYAQLRSTGWNDYPNAREIQGIVEANTPQWIFNPDTGKYYFAMAPDTWTDTRALAEQFGWDLATVLSQSENDWLRDTFMPYLGSAAWLGLTDEAQEGVWMWTTGGMVGYANWGANEPSNSGGGEHFGAMRSDGFWNDAPGTIQYPAIVEMPEPATCLLLGAGLLGAAWRRRRRA